MGRRKKDLLVGKPGFFQSIIIKRILAFLLDFLIINVLIFMPFSTILEYALPLDKGISYATLTGQDAVLGIIYPVLFFVVLFAFFYFVLLEFLIGQTVGKIFLNLKVSSMKGNISLSQAMLRSLFLIPFFPFTLLWIIDPLYLLMWSKDGQRLTELLSSTYVMKTGENNE